MVARMMRWRPWPPQAVTKYQVRLVVRSLEAAEEGRRLAVEIRWKGPKARLGTLRRTVRRNFTREEEVRSDGVIAWEEEFHSVCNLSSANKDNAFSPWEIAFTVFNGFNQGTRAKASSIGTASLNLAEYVSIIEEGKEFEVILPLTVSACSVVPLPSLSISLSLLELQMVEQSENSVSRSIVPVQSHLQSGETLTTEKDEFSAFKAGLRKVKTFTEYVSARRGRKASRKEEGSECRCNVRSDSEYTSPFDSDSLDYFEDGGSDDGLEDSSVRQSISYGTLAEANCAGGSFYSTTRISAEGEDLIYYSNQMSDVRCLPVEDSAASVSDLLPSQSSKRGILSWRKRKLSFRSPKAKGEPLLKKAYGEEGGDDIDFDRRQLSSDESNHSWWRRTDDSIANRSSVSEFGDDSFAVGSWEQKEIVSRDGHWKLQTQVFFASIDQRSEQAAGESACTALVAVIADWLQSNRDVLPIKSQFDSLIREGSLEWRNLCANETYMERFPDKHFDLETVLQANICHLSVAPQKSFIGFFHPEGIDEDRYEVLHGAMSFDSIWDEISCSASELLPCDGEPQVYVICWNDHFFVLKVEPEAFYIIDTLGERLFEGCKQAYILKFDRNTTIHELTSSAQSPGISQSAVDSKSLRAQPKSSKDGGSVSGAMDTEVEDSNHVEKEEQVVCQGKVSCKEYIKNFLAAIPIRELQADIKKGSMSSTHLHQRLQIEFHYTQFLQPQSHTHTVEETASEAVDVAISDNAA